MATLLCTILDPSRGMHASRRVTVILKMRYETKKKTIEVRRKLV